MSVDSHSSSEPGLRVPAIDGLRGWLAFAVVAYHLASIVNLDSTTKLGQLTTVFGQAAVGVFMAASGFVIAGVLIERRESYAAFITRRAFRIFPAYWVALAFGAVATFLKLDAMAHMTWANDPGFATYAAEQSMHVEVLIEQPIAQTLVHIALLQNLAPPALLPDAPLAMLGPAWSLSVEWQFYLVAPLLAWAFARSGWAIIVVVIAALGLVLETRTVPSDYFPDTSLLLYLHVFVLGMASRYAFSHLRELQHFAWPIAIGILVLRPHWQLWLVGALWSAFVILAARNEPGKQTRSAADRAFDFAFASPVAKWLGARSYSIYILHVPIIATVAWLILPLYPLGNVQALLLFAALSIPLTIIAADLSYRFIELPMIKRGALLARRMGRGHHDGSDARPTSRLGSQPLT